MSTEDIVETEEDSMSPGVYDRHHSHHQHQHQPDQDKLTADAAAHMPEAGDCASGGLYLECKHCSLLSNQSKNNALNQYAQQSK